MKRNLVSSAHGVVMAAVAIALVVPGTVLSQDGKSARPAGPAPAGFNYLIGGITNNSPAATTFASTYGGDAWNFTASGLSATTIVARCPNGTACWGVQGTGTAIGVYGSASNSANASGSIKGVQGVGGSTGSNGQSYGGYFSASNSASGGKAYGVYGSGANAGVYAESSNGNGVYAKSTYTSGNGVYATGSGSSFYGVWGDVGGGGYGVVGNSSGGGTGVYGSSSGSTTKSSDTGGVYGYNSLQAVGSASVRNAGVFGTCTSCNGVHGTSANYVGVRGSTTGAGAGTYGGYFSAAKGTGLYTRTTTGQTAFRAVNPNKTPGFFAGVFDGNVRINGNYYATGTKTAIVKTSEGDRLMYAEEATQNYFSDQGIGRLKGGRLVVRIDRLFAQTVDLTQPYMVIVTPQSFDTAGLGVGNLTARSFEVRELGGGNGSFTFSWRITAVRKGFADVRMAAAPANARITDADGKAALPTKATSTDAPTAPPPTRKRAPAAGKHVGAAQKKGAKH